MRPVRLDIDPANVDPDGLCDGNMAMIAHWHSYY